CGGDEGQRVEELVTCGELEGREALRREPRRERVCAQGARGDADQPEEGTDREEDTVHVVAIYVTPLRCGSPARRRWRFGSWTEASPWIDPGLPPAHTVLPGGAGPGAPSEPAASHGVYSRAGTDTNPRTAIDAQEAHAAPRRGADRRRHAHLLPRLHPPCRDRGGEDPEPAPSDRERDPGSDDGRRGPAQALPRAPGPDLRG